MKNLKDIYSNHEKTFSIINQIISTKGKLKISQKDFKKVLNCFFQETDYKEMTTWGPSIIEDLCKLDLNIQKVLFSLPTLFEIFSTILGYEKTYKFLIEK